MTDENQRAGAAASAVRWPVCTAAALERGPVRGDERSCWSMGGRACRATPAFSLSSTRWSSRSATPARRSRRFVDCTGKTIGTLLLPAHCGELKEKGNDRYLKTHPGRAAHSSTARRPSMDGEALPPKHRGCRPHRLGGPTHRRRLQHHRRPDHNRPEACRSDPRRLIAGRIAAGVLVLQGAPAWSMPSESTGPRTRRWPRVGGPPSRRGARCSEADSVSSYGLWLLSTGTVPSRPSTTC
jgi:hypothetical protein